MWNGTHTDPKMNPKMISLGCASGTIRIRKHGNGTDHRVWEDVRDFTPSDGWFREVYDYLDVHFGFVSPDLLAPGPYDSFPVCRRPIQDNPQA